ncbi:NUDIX domain-containing protein [Candidatus Gracilibacteria bacterium]|nr:NUDIX domain-containing protein [Candidatus Gracilibacteria bacterium]
MLNLISTLQSYGDDFPDEKNISDRISEWIQTYGEFAFVKENLEGHITASILITNPSRTRVLLMFHKRFQTWSQFGGHCDGEIDTKSVALREFHEESGILEDPDIIGDIFSLQIWDVAERTSSTGMFQPDHQHYDILYLASIPEDIPFSRQEDEVDDIQWFDIEGIEKYIGEKRMLDMIRKIKTLGK